MRSVTSIIRLVLAICLLCGQITGGYARVVHCYDSKCSVSGISWECHANCVGDHHSRESKCDHNHCDTSAAETISVTPDAKHGIESIQSGLCGSDHHHHFISSIDLVLAAFQSSSTPEFGGPAAFLEMPAQVFEVKSTRLPIRGQVVGRYPSIPLVARLRI